MKKKIIQALIVILGLGLLIGYVILKEGVTSMSEKLLSVNYFYILLAVGCLLTTLFMDSYAIHLVRQYFQPEATFKSSLYTGFVSTSFGYITPFQTGYVAYAIAHLCSNQKMKASDSSATVMIKIIYYMVASVLTHGILIGLNYQHFDVPPIIWVLTILGISVSVVYIFFLILVSKATRFLTVTANTLINFLGKIKIIKKTEALKQKASTEITSLKTIIEETKLAKTTSLKLFISSCINCMANYSVSYFVYLAFNPSPKLDAFFVITGQSICQLIQLISPIPGGIGIVDTAFTQIMNSIFGENLNVAMLFSRLISLYFAIFIGFAIMVIFSKKKS